MVAFGALVWVVGAVIPWYRGAFLVLGRDNGIPWCFVFMVPWYHGTVVQGCVWCLGTGGVGTVVHWYRGELTPWDLAP